MDQFENFWLSVAGDGKYFENGIFRKRSSKLIFENAFYPFLTKKDASSSLFAPVWTENISYGVFEFLRFQFIRFNMDGALKIEREIEIERRLSVAARLM